MKSSSPKAKKKTAQKSKPAKRKAVRKAVQKVRKVKMAVAPRPAAPVAPVVAACPTGPTRVAVSRRLWRLRHGGCS